MQHIGRLVKTSNEITLAHHGVGIRQVEQVNDRFNVQPLPYFGRPRNSDAKQVHAGQPTDSSWLQDHRLVALIQFGAAEDVLRLKWIARYVLEVHAAGESIGKFVGARQLEYIGGIEIQVAVGAIDVLVGIVKVIRPRTAIKRGGKDAFGPLDGEASKNLPAAREALDCSELDSVVCVVVEFRNVADQEVR